MPPRPSRSIPLLLIALALLPLAGAREAAGQPPRRGPYPDRSRSGGGDESRFALSLHTGFRAVDIQSGLFADNKQDFGIRERDFLAARYGLEFDFTGLPLIDIVIGVETGEREIYSSYLDYTYDDGSEIEHATRLGLTEVTLGGRIRLTRGSGRFQPYLLGGFSGTFYRYSEVGDFVDFQTDEVFYDEFVENSFQPGFFAGAGADVALVQRPYGRSIAVFGEFRYARSQGTHQNAFNGFGNLTVGRYGGIFGVRFRF